ncbi:MAG: hypothetical protein IKV35_04095, partial [Clostridia bacterium]|nr:hypothetical protein [Clostridia bacterium]
MTPISYYELMRSDDADLFTIVCKPDKDGTFPTAVFRSPYVDAAQEIDEQELCDRLLAQYHAWVEDGYVIVFQHCRGRGKSSGDCIPYLNERKDGLCLQDWVRHQPFYNGEIYLCGGSYCASVHFVTAPFAADIKGAVLEVQDQFRYNCNFRNGFYKSNLHGGWYMDMYKKKSIPNKSFTPACYNLLPLTALSKSVFGEASADFDEILMHPDKTDPFWTTSHVGGCESVDAVTHTDIPILFETGWYDIFTGGIFDMWNGMDTSAKAKCALLVHPYAHSGAAADQPIAFPNGEAVEAFGDFERRWFNA